MFALLEIDLLDWFLLGEKLHLLKLKIGLKWFWKYFCIILTAQPISIQ